MKYIKYILIVAVFLILVFVLTAGSGKDQINNNPEPAEEVETDNTKEGNIKAACMSAGGTYDDTYSECMGINDGLCTALGGTWQECASACRHDPSAEFCTMQCVQVCEFKLDTIK
jgi:hypothetical protein